MKPDHAELLPAAEVVEREDRAATDAVATAVAHPSGLLESIVAVSGSDELPRIESIERFLAAPDIAAAIAALFKGRSDLDKDRIVCELSRAIAASDRLLNKQLAAILHHPRFQRLEASWRGLQYLTDQVPPEESRVKVRVLNISRRELKNDLERSSEFDQSQLFRKVYEGEFGVAGGEPFGVMIADYEFTQHPDDVHMLRGMSGVGAAAFCPMIANASPALFGMDDFEALERTADHSRNFAQSSFLPWRSFRETADARFVAMTLPRVLMRLPYEDDGTRVDRFMFREDVSGPDRSKYLWGGAAFALGEVIIRAFVDSGWLADIRGVRRGEEGGGLVTALPVHSFATDRVAVAPKCSTDVLVREDLEKELSDLGFVSLCHCQDTNFSAFYSSQSIQKPKQYDRAVATINARISSMLQYMLCAARFAHYLKVLGRDRIGSVADHRELERFLHQWVHEYVTADSDASLDVKARRPLREARVKVDQQPGKPGSFRCTMHLAPHYQLDEVVANVRLVTMLTGAAER